MRKTARAFQVRRFDQFQHFAPRFFRDCAVAIGPAAVTQLVAPPEKFAHPIAFFIRQIERRDRGFGIDRVWLDAAGAGAVFNCTTRSASAKY